MRKISIPVCCSDRCNAISFDENMAEAEQYETENFYLAEELAKALMDKEMLSGEQIEDIIATAKCKKVVGKNIELKAELQDIFVR